PRCRERNRRWRKSHLNKDLTASYFFKYNNLNLFKLDADRGMLSAEITRDTKSAAEPCTW
ncbi:MAG: hypothetical protein WKF34_13060, partial [Pyrinomonadaceae bacterium]